MNARTLADRLVAAGLDPPELSTKIDLYESVRSTFESAVGAAPECGCWVPGRLEVFGTHTDYAGGRTLVSALPRGFVFLARARSDQQLRIVDAAARESVSIDATAKASAGAGHPSGWRHYAQVVVDRLTRNFPGAALGADLLFASDLPRAAGMSSSSALMVGIAATLVRTSGIRERREWQANIHGALDEAGYYACIENGRPFAALMGDAGVGTHGGSEDHAAMVCGTGGTLTAYGFVPMRRLDTVRLPQDWRVVVTSSGVAAEKTGAARTSYNRVAQGAAILLDLWNASERPAVSLAAALGSDPSARERLRSLIRAAGVPGWPADALEMRLQHFVREDARVPEAVRAVRNEDMTSVGALAASSQSDSEMLLKNQVAQTVALSRLALACGAFASRSFGAGFGGSVWALIGRRDAAAFVDRWRTAYSSNYPEARAVSFLAQPGAPVVELVAEA